MGVIADKLLVKVEADAAGLDRVLGESVEKIDDFSSRFGKVAGVAGIVAGGVLAAGSALLVLAKQAVASAAGIEKAARAAGLSAEQYQVYQIAAEKSAVATDTLDRSMATFFDRTRQAQNSTGPLVKGLKDTDAALLRQLQNARSQDEAFRIVADRVRRAKTETEAYTIATAAFGPAGREMVAVLRRGSAGFDEIEAKARAAGQIMSNEVVSGAGAAQQKLDELAAVLKRQLTVALVESADDIAAVATELIELLPHIANATREFLKFLGVLSRRPNEVLATLDAQIAALEKKKQPGGRSGFELTLNKNMITGTDVLDEQLADLRARRKRILESGAAPSLGNFQKGVSGGDLAGAFGQIGPGNLADVSDDGSGLGKTRRRRGGGGGGGDKDGDLIATLQREIELLGKSERARSIDTALRRLSATATGEQRVEVERLAGRLFDETKAQEKDNELKVRAKQLLEDIKTPQELYRDALAEINELLEAGAINHDEHARAVAKLRKEYDTLGTKIEQEMNSALDQILDLGLRGEATFQDLANVARQAFAEIAKAAIQELSQASGGTGGIASGIVGFLGDIAGSLFGGGGGGSSSSGATGLGGFNFSSRAGGGPVQKGRAFEVGEMGPELFKPSVDGTIFTQADLRGAGAGGAAGGVTVEQNIYIDASGAQRGVGEEVRSELAKESPKIVAQAVVAVENRMHRRTSLTKAAGATR